MAEYVPALIAEIERLRGAIYGEPATLLHYARVFANTIDQMREDFRKNPLWEEGDAILIWANEGDLQLINSVEVMTPADHADKP